MEHRHGEGRGGRGHADHIGEFKRRFWVSLLLTAPILVLSEMIQAWFNFSVEIPFQRWVLLLLSSLVYFYGGWPFLLSLIHI